MQTAGDTLLKALPTGRAQAIKKVDLMHTLYQCGFPMDERAFRDLVHDLRQGGHLICSTTSEPAGYYMAADRSEFDEFSDRELLARIRDLAKTISTMRRAAVVKFGKQRRLL